MHFKTQHLTKLITLSLLFIIVATQLSFSKTVVSTIPRYSCFFQLHTDGSVDARINISYNVSSGEKTSGFKKFCFKGDIQRNSISVVDKSGAAIDHEFYTESKYQVIDFFHKPIMEQNTFTLKFTVNNAVGKNGIKYILDLENIGKFGIPVKAADYTIRFPSGMVVESTDSVKNGKSVLELLGANYIITVNQKDIISDNLKIQFSIDTEGVTFDSVKKNIISYEVFIILLGIVLIVLLYFFYKKYEKLYLRLAAVIAAFILIAILAKAYWLLAAAVFVFIVLYSSTSSNSGSGGGFNNAGGGGGGGGGGCGG